MGFKLKFTRINQWGWLSDCGSYSISASKIDDQYGYSAWYVVPKQVAQCLGTVTDPAEARKLCDDHKAAL